MLLANHDLSRRSAPVRRESLRRSSSAIQLLTVLTISRLLCRSVFSEGSTGKLFELSPLPRFRTLTPEVITSSLFSPNVLVSALTAYATFRPRHLYGPVSHFYASNPSLAKL